MWGIWAAKAMGEERSKASISIEPGKFADMAALSDDIFGRCHGVGSLLAH
jgi:predicted amidohydrolase YtcJ